MNPIGPTPVRYTPNPRFGAKLGMFDGVFGNQGEDAYNRIMSGSGRIEVTQAGAGVLNGYILEHPEQALALRRRLIELKIPKARIDQIFAEPPPPPKPTLQDAKAQDALKVLEEADSEFRRIRESGRMPTYHEGRRMLRRVAMQAHGDYNDSHKSDGGKFGPVMEAWNIISPFLKRDS